MLHDVTLLLFCFLIVACETAVFSLINSDHRFFMAIFALLSEMCSVWWMEVLHTSVPLFVYILLCTNLFFPAAYHGNYLNFWTLQSPTFQNFENMFSSHLHLTLILYFFLQLHIYSVNILGSTTIPARFYSFYLNHFSFFSIFLPNHYVSVSFILLVSVFSLAHPLVPSKSALEATDNLIFFHLHCKT
jgi:hypothetical protein